QGDAKTLLAFNLPKAKTKNLAGFTIECSAPGQAPFYLLNSLQFRNPLQHAQDRTQPADASINAPLHKFRWLHVPGSPHDNVQPVYGNYTYTVTPRYFDANGSLLAIDVKLSVAVTIDVAPFAKGSVEVGFTRGFVQSQAFVHHFGPKAIISPKAKGIGFDTS